MDMNGLAMARYGPRLRQDVATGHMNLLEPYLALFKPSLDETTPKNVKNPKKRYDQKRKTKKTIKELI